MKVVHVRQPADSKLCGHSVLAMVSGVSLEEACKTLGHRRGTRTGELVAALGDLALCGRLSVIGRRPLLSLPDPCILKVCWEERHRSHYVLRVGTSAFDPVFSVPLDLSHWAVYVEQKKGRITSYLPVRLP